MSDPQRKPERDAQVVMGPLTPTAVQALYHAATGKTENLTKRLKRNFILRRSDLDQLYSKVNQQMDHYTKLVDPTVTTKVKFSNGESQQFSSWERFSIFDSSKVEIVSEILIKFEFIIRLPETNDPQRYILNIDIDSMLPVVSSEEFGQLSSKMFLFPLDYFSPLTISIDFVDYLCAKNFSQVIEDWFYSLEESENPKWLNYIRSELINWPTILRSFGNFSAAAFLASYASIKMGNFGDSQQISYFISILIVLWTLSGILCAYIGSRLFTTMLKSKIPPCILLTSGDQRAFSKVIGRSGKTLPQFALYIFGVLGTLGLNVCASYIYAFFTR